MIGDLLYQQIPVRRIICHWRPSCIWFDDECHRAKQSMCSQERDICRASGHSTASLSSVTAWRSQRRQYTELLGHKRSVFWTSRINVDQSQSHCLWRYCRYGPAPVLHQHKVNDVCTSTIGGNLHVFTPAPACCELRVFSSSTPADVIALVRSLPEQQCSSDPWPTWLLKENIDLISPFLCHLLNWSLEHGTIL